MKTAIDTAALPATASIEVILDVILQIINVFEAILRVLENLGLRLGGGS